ncbi:DinB family protein [Nocardioides pelophilus]|uniref:DinB family protein n=1 Tax=Nocardioides pelophilus TaxID=2172019 RepID=UPI0016011A4B|nr:DinB family protein [Nocardioides pelophilus]
MSTSGEIAPDTKDWTWVLDRPCPECGLDSGAVDRADLGPLILDNAIGWQRALAAPQAAQRPEPAVWSPTEYAAHVRDVHRIFAERVGLMLAEDDPTFANWDQDETALTDRYDLQQPEQAPAELLAAAEVVAAAYDAVPGEAWDRRGTRSNGSVFTVESIGRYHLHDVVHHLWDVRWVEAAPSAPSAPSASSAPSGSSG